MGENVKSRLDPARLAALVGSFAAFFLAFNTLLAWVFGRGMLGVLGFPQQIVPLRSSLELFSGIGVEYSSGFAFSLVIGYIILPKGLMDNKGANRICGLVTILLTIAALHSVFLGPFIDAFWLLNYLWFSPFLIGVCIKVIRNNRSTSWLLLVFGLTGALILNVHCIFIAGEKAGIALATIPEPYFTSMDRTIVPMDADEYPLVTLRSKEKLDLVTTPIADGTLFTYKGTGSSFLRLMLADQENYYMIEVQGDVYHAFAVRKDSVVEISFINQPVSRIRRMGAERKLDPLTGESPH
ncbi:MAG TPA: hypothetical protein VLK33_21760 [Terriglobales bacterium]|nr:hypothetical protein [Terriglobales bacterium]